jgi:opacity protein-like surface antigen
VVGIELGYVDYGTYDAKTSGNEYSYSAKGYSLSANLGYSFMDSQLRPFANLGAAYLSTKHKNLQANFVDATDDTGIGFHYGLGVQYEPNALKGVGFRIAYEIDSYATAIKTTGTTSDIDKTYTLSNSVLYAAVQYKF